MAKLRPRKAPVYKLVFEEPDGRLVSAIVRKSASQPKWRTIATCLQRTYRSAGGRLRTVRQAMAFCRRADAEYFMSDWRACDTLQLWEARCDRAVRIRHVIGLPYIARWSARLFLRLWGEPDGWTRDRDAAPPGSLLCENLRLLRRLEP